MMPEDYKRSLLKDISDQKEKDMENPRKESMPPATPEERISALEKKVRDQDALIKGLTEEFLDLKSITMRLNKVTERPEVKVNRPPTAAAGGGTGTVVVAKRPVPTTAARAPPPPEPEKMDMIMQPDGTLKPEKRKVSSDYIVASAAYSKKGKDQQGSGKKSNLIVAEDEEKEAPKK